MVALLDLEDIITAVGREPSSPEEAAKWQFYIDTVSAFINSYVTASFEEIADDIIRRRADYYGVIDLGGDPISAVTSVKNVKTAQETVWDFDGMNKIRYLDPNEVVDITYDHGYAAVPDDVRYMAVQAVLGALDVGDTGELVSFTVGDISETYSRVNDTGPTVVSLSREVLRKYTDEQRSLRMGAGQATGFGVSTLPTL